MDSTSLAFTLDSRWLHKPWMQKKMRPLLWLTIFFGGSGNLGKDAGSRVITVLCRKNCCCYQGRCKTVRLPLLMPFGSVFELESQQLHPKHAWEVRLQTFSDQTSSQIDSNATSLYEMRCKRHMDTIFDAKLGTDAGLRRFVQHCWCGFQRLDQSPGRTPQSFEDECYILMPWLRGSGPKFWSISQLSACNKTSKCCDTDFNTLHNLHNTSWTLVCLRVLNHSRKTNCSGQKHPSTRRPNLSYLICSFQFAESIIPLGLTKAELGFFLFSITKESESNIRSFLCYRWPESPGDSSDSRCSWLCNLWAPIMRCLLFMKFSHVKTSHRHPNAISGISCTLRKLLIFGSKLSPQLLGRLHWAGFQFQQHSSLPVLWRTHVDRFYGSLPDLFNHCNSLFLDLRSIDKHLTLPNMTCWHSCSVEKVCWWVLLQVIVNIARRCELISQSAWPRQKHCQIAWFEKPQDCSSECLTFKMFIHSPFPSMS